MKSRYKFFSFILTLTFLLITLLSGCANGIANQQPVKLTYYVNQGVESIIVPHLDSLAEKSDNTEFERFSGDINSAIGENGADIIFLSTDYDVLEQGMGSMLTEDNFIDLTLLINNDTSFSLDHYVPMVEAGVVEGKRLGIPLYFMVESFVTSQENMDYLQFTEDSFQSYDAFLSMLQRYSDIAAENSYLFFPQKMGMSLFFPWNGLDFFKMTDNLSAYQPTFEAYRSVYAFDNKDIISVSSMDEVAKMLQNHEVIAYQAQGFSWMDYYSTVSASGQTPLLFPAPSVDGNMYGAAGVFMCINKYSNNDQSAYELLKQMLSDSVQSLGFGGGIPVLESAIEPAATVYSTNFSKTDVPKETVEQFAQKVADTEFSGSFFSYAENAKINSVLDLYFGSDGSMAFEQIANLIMDNIG